jgi:excisionase family DNA binding protein
VSELAFTLSDELVERIAERAAAIVLERSTIAESGSPWLTLDQAAQRLGCSVDAVRMRARRGRLVTKHQGRRVYVSRESVDGLQ